jgi:hypothetical protein
MSNTGYLILGYVVSLGLLWGYAVMLWVHWRHTKHRSAQRDRTNLLQS